MKKVKCEKIPKTKQFLTTETFIERAILLHGNKYDYSKLEYKKWDEQVEIICVQHGIFWQKASDHLNGRGCLECGRISTATKNTLTLTDFLKKANKCHSNFYDYSKVVYKNSTTKIEIICPKHGSFWQSPNSHTDGFVFSGCQKCSIEKRNLNNTYTTEIFIKKSEELYGKRFDYSKVCYKHNKIEVEIICPKHGSFFQKPKDHLYGKTSCASCGKELGISKLSLTYNEFVKKANEAHDNFYDYSKVVYKNSRTKIEIICPKHGSFWQPPSSHIHGTRKNGCPRCVSSISKISQRWLDYLKVPKIIGTNREVTINIDNNKFRVDGYDPQINTIYEFHGDWWHGNPKLYNLHDIHPISKKSYGELLESTQKRSRLLKSAGYNVVSIWESDWKKIEKEIKEND